MKYRILSFLSLIIAIILPLFIIFQKLNSQNPEDITIEDVKKQAFIVANTIANSCIQPIVEEDILSLAEIVANLKKTTKYIKEIAIINKYDTIVAHTNIEKQGEYIPKEKELPYFSENVDYYVTEVPIMMGNTQIGRTRLVLDKDFFKIPEKSKLEMRDFYLPILLFIIFLLFSFITSIFEKREARKDSKRIETLEKEFRMKLKRLEEMEKTFRKMLEYNPPHQEVREEKPSEKIEEKPAEKVVKDIEFELVEKEEKTHKEEPEKIIEEVESILKLFEEKGIEKQVSEKKEEPVISQHTSENPGEEQKTEEEGISKEKREREKAEKISEDESIEGPEFIILRKKSESEKELITLDSILASAEEEREEKKIEEVKVEKEKPPSYEVKIKNASAFPNPCIIGKDNLIIRFECNTEIELRLTISDKEKIRKEIYFPAKVGENQIIWDGKIEENKYISPGFYIVRLLHKDKPLFQRRIIFKT